MRDKIEKILALQGCEGYDAIGEIISLLAPELEKARILNDKIGHLVATDIAVLVEKARKWDRVKEIAARDNSEECDKSCPYYDPDIVDQCKIFAGCPFCQVFDALSKESAELAKKMMEVSK